MHKNAIKALPVLAIGAALWVLYAHSPLGSFNESWGLSAVMTAASIALPVSAFFLAQGRLVTVGASLFILLLFSGGVSLSAAIIGAFTSDADEAMALSEVRFMSGVGFFTMYLAGVVMMIALMVISKLADRDEAEASTA